jgi:hypothetical protein
MLILFADSSEDLEREALEEALEEEQQLAAAMAEDRSERSQAA